MSVVLNWGVAAHFAKNDKLLINYVDSFHTMKLESAESEGTLDLEVWAEGGSQAPAENHSDLLNVTQTGLIYGSHVFLYKLKLRGVFRSRFLSLSTLSSRV